MIFWIWVFYSSKKADPERNCKWEEQGGTLLVVVENIY